MPIVAADIMSSPVVTVTPKTTLGEIAKILSQKRISAVPVLDDSGKVVGIVSEADVLKPYRESIIARRTWWLDLIAEGEDLPKDFLEYLRQDHHVAADLMVPNVVVADHQMTIPELAELAMKHGVRRLPILKDGKLVGIISRADLVRVIAQTPALVG
ncbi:MAG: CBS domain-containing protein [Acetobacteraceae bacterium]|nr:CBS domain-containing protein [Pseudomonadota bacterium]